MSDLVKRLRKQTSSGRDSHVSKADRLAAADTIEAQAARIAELEERYRLIAGDKINLRGQLASLEGRIADFKADLARKQATIEAAIHEIENRGGDWALSTLKGETP